MFRCAKCHWKYPNNLLLRVTLNDSLCAICALEAINGLMGTAKQKFITPLAESIRLAALMWREHHPNDAPITGDRNPFS